MKEETIRIMKLVKEGKLSPEDAAELLDAFGDAPHMVDDGENPDSNERESAEEGDKPRTDDPFGKLIGTIEQVTKDVAKNVNWQDIADTVRKGVDKGVEAVKQVAEDAGKGRGGWFKVFGQQADRIIELPLEVPSGKTLKIEGGYGDIKVEGGEPIGSIKVAARFKGYTEEEAKELAEKYMPVLEEGHDFIALRHNEADRLSADIHAKVSEGTVVEIKTSHGDVEVIGTKASLKVNCANGSVKLVGVGGTVEVFAQSGSVALDQTVCSMVTIESKSGDVTLSDVNGLVNIRSNSGDVELSRCSGRTISVEASTGDINIDLVAPVEGSVNLRSVKGDVNLAVSDGSDCRVHLSTLKGDVKVVDLELKDEVREKLVVSGKLGDGSGSIDMSAVTGDVSLSLRDSSV